MSKKLKETSKQYANSIHADTKKAVASVFLFAFSAIIIISSFGIGGKLGNAIFSLLEYTFGWGAYLLAASLTIIGILILKSISALACSTTVVSMIAMFASSLGLIQLIFGFSKAEKSSGGKLGQMIGASLENMFGFHGGIILVFAFFLASILITLNISLAGLWEKISGKKLAAESESINPKAPLRSAGSSFDNSAALGRQAGQTFKDEEKESKWVSIKKIISSKNSEEDKDIAQPKETPADKEKEGFSANKILFKNKSFTKEADDYKGFPIDILAEKASGKNTGGLSKEDLGATSNIIKKTLENFNINVEMKDINIGPTVAQYTLKPAEGVKLSKIVSLQNDLALSLAAHPIRIEAPIPGKSLVGIEVPNKSIATVRLRNLLEDAKYKNQRDPLCVGLGLDVSGETIFSNLAKMPHLLIAGSTGSGKSVAINSILINLLYSNSPKKLRLILIDPKRVELSCYNGIPHLLAPVIFDSGKTISALKWAVKEMEERLKKLQDAGVRDIASYNEKETEESMPYIVIIIDELADLMTGNSSNEVETGIVRLAQMARAVGIHLIVSTQRPSVEVITGLIKANIPARIAFRVASQIDSRTILDASGAEKLLGNGDMLFLAGNQSKPKRIQGAFLSENEVKKVVDHITSEQEKIDAVSVSPDETDILDSAAISPRQQEGQIDFKSPTSADPLLEDDLYNDAKEIILQAGKASASLLQRKLRIGYARAARLIDIFEENGVIGQADGARPREVFYDSENLSKNNSDSQNNI